MSGTITNAAVEVRRSLRYAAHDGVELTGDLYLPHGRDGAPLLVSVHGGGWQVGNPDFYQHWGPLLAANGFGCFAIRYRLASAEAKSYPAAIYDVKAALRFAHENGPELGFDPGRIGLVGDSAGAHLAGLAALAGDTFVPQLRDHGDLAAPADVKVVVGFYGVYDLLAQWQHDQIARPRDQITEKFLGTSPSLDRQRFLQASPINHVSGQTKNKPAFLLIYGTDDEIVDPQTQSQAFLAVLKEAGFFVRTFVLPGAGHFWAADPMEEPGSLSARAAFPVIRFLREKL
ncbi:MAG: alpha/beta hydrolase fold domain-containing protein [Xanthobacteraceae bacterium]